MRHTAADTREMSFAIVGWGSSYAELATTPAEEAVLWAESAIVGQEAASNA